MIEIKTYHLTNRDIYVSRCKRMFPPLNVVAQTNWHIFLKGAHLAPKLGTSKTNNLAAIGKRITLNVIYEI